ncbi:ABC transporter ATP-binding protein [Desulforamulus aquiferis]|uniref:ATP-binding cassette domain-containing protein n=1 Tax=Desulforamulus aquiferis TaxID=1397668 RepID=A0AAW7Z8F4_9FIRM|nr:ATP-binding cassette domain-containing protein [Desulforamulus aquiferis]MDO7785653.1 ATP-binding cassette domain-containing protein [Desulforamulus aquiferis]RYD03245.1 hypothetical protein N752_20655 [Desulforamulus aquiferis]
MMLFRFEGITYTLGLRQERKISVSGSLNEGFALIVRGPSGAGKSTLLRVLAKLQTCLAGEAYLEEKSWQEIPVTTWRSKVHYLSQKPALFDGTVAENLARPFGILAGTKKQFDPNLAARLMKELLLPSDLWDQDARTLSGGEAARLAFIRSLLIDPMVLLLDEPTASLDEKSRCAFYEVLSRWLAQPSKAALLISHNNDFRELSQLAYLDIDSNPRR